MSETKTKLKKNDQVVVIAGKAKGKRGKLIGLDRVRARAFVGGVNLVKKAKKKRKQTDRGGIIQVEAPISLSNLMIICNKCGPTRSAIEINNEGKKIRVCRKCHGGL